MKDRTNNNVLEIIQSAEFEADLFGLTIKLYKWYDFSTKLVFLEFFRQLIEEGCAHNIEDFNTIHDKKFLEFMRVIQEGITEMYILNVIQVSMKTNDTQIVHFTERLAASMIKIFFNTSL